MGMTKIPALAAALLLTFRSTAFAAEPAAVRSVAADGFTLELTDADREREGEIRGLVARGRGSVETFFGRPFPRAVTVKLFPDRAALTAFWREDWKAPDLVTECWMVASGTARSLALLSPGAWRKEACDHDPADAVATARLVTHELVHVYHGQSSPSPEFDGLASLAASTGRVVSRQELLREVWQRTDSARTVDVHLSWLRRKLGDDLEQPRFIHVHRGVGVLLEDAEAPLTAGTAPEDDVSAGEAAAGDGVD